MIKAVIRLRRDNDFNYAKIKDSFVPANGEICLVDTARDGLRAVCGDGKSTFAQLKFLNDLIVKGYYKDGNFYSDSDFQNLIEASTIKFYIALNGGILYYYNGQKYEEVGKNLPAASITTPGAMKLYDTTGDNIDGTMTQKAITEGLNSKVELTINEDEELIVFSL